MKHRSLFIFAIVELIGLRKGGRTDRRIDHRLNQGQLID